MARLAAAAALSLVSAVVAFDTRLFEIAQGSRGLQALTCSGANVPLLGMSGLTLAYGFNRSDWMPYAAGSSRCGSPSVIVPNGTRSVVYQIDAGQTIPAGSIISVDTCSSFPSATLNTTLFLGWSCPANSTDFNGLKCQAANEDNSAQCGSGKPGLSALKYTVTAATASRYWYVAVAMPSNFVFASGQGARLNYSITLPPTPSGTPSNTATPTASATPDPLCLGQVPWTAQLSGSSGSVNGTMSADANSPALWYQDPGAWPDTALCTPAGDDWDQMPFPTQYGLVFSLDYRPTDGGDFIPGGVIQLDTCGSDFDTTIYVSNGCPITAATYGCLAYNDDDTSADQCAGYVAPMSNTTSNSSNAGFNDDYGYGGGYAVAMTSRLLVPTYGLGYPQLFIILSPSPLLFGDYGGDYGGTAGGATSDYRFPGGNWTLTWRYLPASGTPSPSATNSPSGSASASWSPSETPSISVTATQSKTVGVSASQTATRTWTPTRSVTRSPSSAITPSWTTSISYSQTGVPTPTKTAGATRTASSTATPSVSPFCQGQVAFNGWLTGLSGSFVSDTSISPWAAGNTGSFAGAVLSLGFDDSGSEVTLAMPVGNKHVLGLDLGPTTLAGGTLRVSLCNKALFDSIMFLGELL